MDKINVEYGIPESKEEILLKDWIAFESLAAMDLAPEFLQKRMLELFCKVPLKHIDKLKQSEVNEMIEALTPIITAKAEKVTFFTFEGVEYGLIPDFDDEIASGELNDLDTYLEKKDWARLLSILYRPVTKRVGDLYQIEPYNGTHEEFLNVGYHIYEGVLSFFLALYLDCVKLTLKYTQKLVKKNQNLNPIYQEKVNSLLNGVDIENYFGSLQHQVHLAKWMK